MGGRIAKRPKVRPCFGDVSKMNELVTFLIGPGDSPTNFQVLKPFVCYHSEVLEAAFDSPLIEGQTQTYRLEDVSEGAFRYFLDWIYREKLNVAQLKNGHDPRKERDDWDAVEDMALVELWVLADKFAILELQNPIISALVDLTAKDGLTWIDTETFSYIYENTADGSPLRKLVVAQVTENTAVIDWESCKDDIPVDMWFDITNEFVKTHDGAGNDGIEAENFFVPINGEFAEE